MRQSLYDTALRPHDEPVILASASTETCGLCWPSLVLCQMRSFQPISMKSKCARIAIALCQTHGDRKQPYQPQHPEAFVITALTVVACGRHILPKRKMPKQHRCLTMLSGVACVFMATRTTLPEHRQMQIYDCESLVRRVHMSRLDNKDLDYIALLVIGWQGLVAIRSRDGRALYPQKYQALIRVTGLDIYQMSQILRSVGFRAKAPASWGAHAWNELIFSDNVAALFHKGQLVDYWPRPLKWV